MVASRSSTSAALSGPAAHSVAGVAELVEAVDDVVELVGGVVRHAVGRQRAERVAGRRVDGAVEHEATHALGVAHGVDRAERRPVAVAEVVEAVDAEGQADLLEVERGVGRADLGQQRAGPGDAVLGGRDVEGADRPAVDRRHGPPDAPRVPADRVVVVEQLARQHVDEVPRQLDARRAGAAGVEHQRSAVVAGVELRSGQGDGDLLAGRVGVVERDGHRRALPGQRQVGVEVRARRPVDRRDGDRPGRRRGRRVLDALGGLLGAHARTRRAGDHRHRQAEQPGPGDPAGHQPGSVATRAARVASTSSGLPPNSTAAKSVMPTSASAATRSLTSPAGPMMAMSAAPLAPSRSSMAR